MKQGKQLIDTEDRLWLPKVVEEGMLWTAVVHTVRSADWTRKVTKVLPACNIFY